MPIVNQIVAYLGNIGSAMMDGAATSVTTMATALATVAKAIVQIGG